MSIDLARLCEAMRDRLYGVGVAAIGQPGVALAQALDAAATELRRQREEAEPVPVMPPGEWTTERVAAFNGLTGDEVAAMLKREQMSEIEEVALELWKASGPLRTTIDQCRCLASFVLHREAKLKKDLATMTEEYRSWKADARARALEVLTLRAEVERLTAELAATKPLVEQVRLFLRTLGQSTTYGLQKSLDDYERARLKAQGEGK